jgi:hypothetical protein
MCLSVTWGGNGASGDDELLVKLKLGRCILVGGEAGKRGCDFISPAWMQTPLSDSCDRLRLQPNQRGGRCRIALPATPLHL